MKSRYLILTLALAAVGGTGAFAQTETETAKPDLTGESTPNMKELARQAEGSVGTDGSAQWYVDMDYAGFDFKIPAGTIVEKGSTLTAKYPDGSFGLSMANENKGSNQKIAFRICRRLASEMKIPNAAVDKVSYGKSDGARATGTLDGQQVTILVLPYGNEQVTIVALNSPAREEWKNQFLRTLKR